MNLRLLDEITEETFASKGTELRDRIAGLSLELEACDRGRAERSQLAEKEFELSQSLTEKWVAADVASKRQLLEIVCLNFSLDGVTLVPTIRKPFDVLAEGLSVPFSRGNWHSFEPLIAAYVDAALGPSSETVVATQVLRLSA